MRILNYVVFVLFVTSIVTTIAFAQPNLTITSIDDLGVGQTGVINVDFVNNGEVNGMQFDLSFNPSLVSADLNGLTFSQAAADLGYAPISALINNNSTLRLAVNPPVVDPLPDLPSGALFSIPFMGVAAGTTTLDIMEVNGRIFANQGVTVPADILTNGAITVEGGPPPFVNVTITKSSDTNRIDPGVPVVITYNIILNSNGDQTAEDVGVTDALPDGAVFDAGMSSPECEMLIGPPNSVGCDVGDIPAGQERVLNIAISITGMEGSILNQAIVDFLDEFGERVENASNTFTIRVGGGGGGGGGSCALASNTPTGSSAVNILLLLMPALVIGIVRLRKYKNVK